MATNVNNGNIRTIYKICPKLTIKTPERRQKWLNILEISSMTSMADESKFAEAFLFTSMLRKMSITR